MEPTDNDKSPVDDTLATAEERVNKGADHRAALNKAVFGEDYQPMDTPQALQEFLAQRARDNGEEEDFLEVFGL